ncbi:MAG: hypothetical protein AAF244_02220, partial [Pseudomonadota bacterium]
MKQNYISKIFWLWVPLVFIIGQVILELILPHELMNASVSENGPHEILQFGIISAAALVPLYCFISRKTDKNIIYKFWFGLAFICCVYVAGEEVSWGQHFFNWNTPESWQAVNDQHETNLHNTSSWLDQKPRLILMLGIVFGTLILPVLVKKNILKLPDNLKILIPVKEFSFLAFLIISTHIIEKADLFGIDLFVRYSEIQEIMLFYFVLIYLVNLLQRLKLP